MFQQMYQCFIKVLQSKKGQDLVEYALLLAIIVGIGWLIYQQGNLADNIKSIFTSAVDLTDSARRLVPATLHGSYN